MSARIYLSGAKGKGKFALVDDEDFAYHSQFKWSLSGEGYAIRNINAGGRRGTVFLHNEVTNFARVDHKNRDKLDCQKENLRETTQGENNRNKGARKNTGLYIGVTRNKRGAYLTHVGHVYHGSYPDAKTAALVSDEVKRRKWAGSVFVENFPNERLPEGFRIVNLDSHMKRNIETDSYETAIDKKEPDTPTG